MLYLVLEVAIDEVGLADDRDCRGEGQEQQSKGEHLVDQTTWSPRQRMTPFEKAGRAVGSHQKNDIAFFGNRYGWFGVLWALGGGFRETRLKTPSIAIQLYLF